MLIESSHVRDLLDTNVTTSLSHHHHDHDDHGDEEQQHQHSPQTHKSPTKHAISLNPIPALVILLVGIMMSSHTQTTEMGSIVHKQWGNLLAGASVSRFLTYVLLYIRPPHSVQPSRPPTELLAAFALIAGGLVFMASASDSVDRMIYGGVNEMFIYTCAMGLVGVVMAWVILLVAVKGWAIRWEMGRKRIREGNKSVAFGLRL